MGIRTESSACASFNMLVTSEAPESMGICEEPHETVSVSSQQHVCLFNLHSNMKIWALSFLHCH